MNGPITALRDRAAVAGEGPRGRTDGDAPRPLLLLYADTGGGHRASAHAVAEEIGARHGDTHGCTLRDAFGELAPRALARAVGAYNPLIRHAPWAWGAAYRATDSRAAVALLRAAFLRFAEPGLLAEVRRLRPAAVVSFHPLLNHVSARVVRHAGVGRIPVITVVTDLVDIHAAWTCPDVDALITASPGGLDHCRRAGMAASRCHDLGLPVAGAFAEASASLGREQLRRRLGIDPLAFTVLVSGGGEGSGGMYRRVRALCRDGLDIQVVAVCGRNQALQARLLGTRVAPPTRLRVEGFVENMAEWLRASDVAVSKAGPGAIAEAHCAGVPLLLTSYVPGQERGNVGFVVATGTGRWVPGRAELVDAVRELAAPGSPGLRAMRSALVHAARPSAAARIADLVCELAGVGASP